MLRLGYITKIIVLLLLASLFLTGCNRDKTNEIDTYEIKDMLDSTSVDELKLSNLLKKEEDIGITKFSISVNSDELVKSMNLSYVLTNSDIEKTIVYRRENDLIHVYEVSLEDDKYMTGTIETIEVFEQMNHVNDRVLDDDEIFQYKLFTPKATNFTANPGDIVNGLKISEEKTIEGIVYRVNVIPVEPSSRYGKFIIKSN